MRTRATMTVSLPPEMIEQVEEVRKTEHRTRSELVREALRTYFATARTYTPTAAEVRAIERGRAAFRHGDYISLEQLHAELDRQNRRPRAKGPRPRAASRA